MSIAILVRFLTLLSLLSVSQLSLARPGPTELRLRGYSVIPSPQKVMLQPEDIDFDATWAYRGGSLGPTHIAMRSLLKDLREFHALMLKPAVVSSKNVVRLAIAEGTVKTAGTGDAASQGYLLKIAPGLIEIIGNGDPGLLYGVQTLLQLLKPGPGGRLQLPAATIEDWPEHALRFLHWDTKHHQDRIETLKRFLDWSTFQDQPDWLRTGGQIRVSIASGHRRSRRVHVGATAGDCELRLGTLHSSGSSGSIAGSHGVCPQAPGVRGSARGRQQLSVVRLRSPYGTTHFLDVRRRH